VSSVDDSALLLALGLQRIHRTTFLDILVVQVCIILYAPIAK